MSPASPSAPNAVIPIRAVRNLIHHPNFDEQIMAVGLGREKRSNAKVLTPEENTPEH